MTHRRRQIPIDWVRANGARRTSLASYLADRNPKQARHKARRNAIICRIAFAVLFALGWSALVYLTT